VLHDAYEEKAVNKMYVKSKNNQAISYKYVLISFIGKVAAGLASLGNYLGLESSCQCLLNLRNSVS
jgi:hypothetical protein